MSVAFALRPRQRLLAASASIGGALFVTGVLVVRLPSAPAALATWWSLLTALVVGGLSAAGLRLLATDSSLLADGEPRLLAGLAAGGVTSVAILATASSASPSALAVACMIAASSLAVSISWGLATPGTDEVHQGLPNEEQSCLDGAATAECPPSTLGFPIEVSPDHGENAVDGPCLPPHVEQTSSRYVAEGRDHLELCLRVRFDAGQQTAILHVPIQPPLADDPDVELELPDEAGLRVSADPAQPYGVRLVCRRSAQCHEAAESVISVLISADQAVARAA